MMGLYRNKHFSFSAIYFLGWAALATFALEFVFYSVRIGFTNTEIGIIFAVKILAGILFQPLFGFISDYIGSTRKMLIVMGVSAAFFSSGLPLASSKLTILILDISYTISACAFMPLLDNWIARESSNEEKFHYGALRLWGSLGYAIVAFIYGRMAMYIDVANMYFGRAMFFVIAVLFIFLNQNEAQAVVKTEKQKPDIKTLFSKKEYWLFFIFLFIFCFPFNASMSFFPKLLLDRGSSSQTIALFSSLNAIIEIPFFLYIKRLTRKIGSRGLILIGCIFTTIRLIGFTFVSSIPLLLAAYLCMAPYATFFLPGFLFYSKSISPKNTEAFTLTSLQGFALGLTGMLGSYFFGLIVDLRGIHTMYALSSVICIIGMTIFISTSVWLKKSTREHSDKTI